MEKSQSRRLFLRTFAWSAAALILAPVVRIKKAMAELVNPDKEPVAKALGYVPNVDAVLADEKAKKVKPADSKLKGRGKTDLCLNCQYYGDASGKAKQAVCVLMGGKEVLGAGWCRSYAARAKSKKS